jgi:hypothetical protein
VRTPDGATIWQGDFGPRFTRGRQRDDVKNRARDIADNFFERRQTVCRSFHSNKCALIGNQGHRTERLGIAAMAVDGRPMGDPDDVSSRGQSDNGLAIAAHDASACRTRVFVLRS